MRGLHVFGGFATARTGVKSIGHRPVYGCRGAVAAWWAFALQRRPLFVRRR